jgi:hypothetical protein
VWCFSQLLNSRFRSRFTKNPYFGTPKMEKHFSSVETKISIRGDPRHPDGHARV